MSSGADIKRVGWRLRPRTSDRLEGECNESRARSSTSSFTSLASGLSLALMLLAAVAGMHDGDSFSDGDACRSDKTTIEGDEGRDSRGSMFPLSLAPKPFGVVDGLLAGTPFFDVHQ